MLNGKTVNIDLLIEMLIQDYGFDTVNKSEVAEWVWRSMSIIGTPYAYEDKNVEISITDYRSILPIDLYEIGLVREKSTGIVLREMTDVFFKFPEANSAGSAVVIETGDIDTDGTTEFETIIGPDTSAEFYTFKVQGNYIFTALETCSLEMSYKAIPINIVDGMPTLPDNAIYLRGIEGFIAEKLAMRMLLKDQISERKYDIIAKNYYFDVGAAQNVCKLPDVSRMETLLNRWKSTYIGPEHFDTGFKHLGSRD